MNRVMVLKQPLVVTGVDSLGDLHAAGHLVRQVHGDQADGAHYFVLVEAQHPDSAAGVQGEPALEGDGVPVHALRPVRQCGGHDDQHSPTFWYHE